MLQDRISRDRIRKRSTIRQSDTVGSSEGKERRVSVRIREMEVDDIAPVFHLGEMLYTADEAPNTYRTWDVYEVVGLFHSDTEFCLVAEVEEQLKGFLLGTTIIKSHSAWKYGYLIWLGVHPDVQRHGVADKLFQKFKDLMIERGIRMLLADTSAENLGALHFFRKQGFGHPHKHIYLTMNLDSEIQRIRRRSADHPSSRPEKKNGHRPTDQPIPQENTEYSD
ncbi:GNAT family N-acetyltransferase [Desulfobulbus oligotrophicus]|uniref:GNAT family N-acetyltransferase n=2 Tax=Desulfobulbus oligotrophicus TaxID=1909699 RepID=A0A7T5VD79_9BACT|nr:GNAT family N-acetyltransferase [Desulfobulbus oligotrophicus]